MDDVLCTRMDVVHNLSTFRTRVSLGFSPYYPEASGINAIKRGLIFALRGEATEPRFKPRCYNFQFGTTCHVTLVAACKEGFVVSKGKSLVIKTSN